MRLWLALVFVPAFAVHAAEITDATGRTVAMREPTLRVLPAGPPAAVVLETLAPGLMIGWPHTPQPAAMRWLTECVRGLPAVPMLTGRQDVTDQIAPLHPDLILDYGSVSPRYADLDKSTQAKTGVPTVLIDGAITKIPAALRTVGAALGRRERAEMLAGEAEMILAAIPPVQGAPPRVLFAIDPDGLDAVAPGTLPGEVFTVMGWQLVAPDGAGSYRHASLEAIRTLDPDIIIFEDQTMRAAVAASPGWSSLRAVKAGHAYVAPAVPFGWLGEPPSLNRLLGVAMLSARGTDIAPLAAQFMTDFYGYVPSPEQLAELRANLQPIAP